jgi:hypothetical protein
VLSRNWVVQDLVLESIEVRPSKEGWLRFDKDRVVSAQDGPPFTFALTLAVSRANCRSEARAKAVGVGSTAMLG